MRLTYFIFRSEREIRRPSVAKSINVFSPVSSAILSDVVNERKELE